MHVCNESTTGNSFTNNWWATFESVYLTSCFTAVTYSTIAELSCTVPLSLHQVYVYLSLCLMCQMFWIGPQLHCQHMNQPRWTGREGDRVLGESTAVRNLMPSTAVMPDSQWASHFVRSLVELWVTVCRYPFSSSWSLATWPGLKAVHACCLHVHQGVISNIKRQRVSRLIGAYKKTKGKGGSETERKEDSGTSLGVSLVSLSPGWNAELLIQMAAR